MGSIGHCTHRGAA